MFDRLKGWLRMTADNRPAELGDKVKDLVSGFEGVVVSVTRWLHGCDRLRVESDTLTDAGVPREGQVFDAMRLAVVARGVLPAPPPQPPPFALGARVRDAMTGFDGVAAAYTVWLGGTPSYLIEPDRLDDRGHPREAHGFDAQRVALVEPRPVPVSPNAPAARTGGPQQHESAALRRR